MKILLLILMTAVIVLAGFKPLVLFNHTTQLPATTIVFWWDSNTFQWEPSCFDAGIYRPTFSSGVQTETITITVNDACDGTLEQFCKLWLKPSANFRHYAIWANKYKVFAN